MYILYSQVLPVGITFHNPHSLYTAYLYSLLYMYTVSYLQIFNFFELSPSWLVFLFSLLVSSPFWSIFFPSWPVSPFSLCVSSTLRSVSLSPSSYTVPVCLQILLAELYIIHILSILTCIRFLLFCIPYLLTCISSFLTCIPTLSLPVSLYYPVGLARYSPGHGDSAAGEVAQAHVPRRARG